MLAGEFFCAYMKKAATRRLLVLASISKLATVILFSSSAFLLIIIINKDEIFMKTRMCSFFAHVFPWLAKQTHPTTKLEMRLLFDSYSDWRLDLIKASNKIFINSDSFVRKYCLEWPNYCSVFSVLYLILY